MTQHSTTSQTVCQQWNLPLHARGKGGHGRVTAAVLREVMGGRSYLP
jgi:hypothetical protein